MTDKLNEKLCKDFPLLYRDRYGDLRSTAMIWGFPFSEKEPGWFNIIYDLSSKLEPLIQKWINENKPTNCANCECIEKLHFDDQDRACFNFHYLPYMFQWKWKSISWPSKAQNWNDRWKIFKTKYLYYGLIYRVKNWIARDINFVLHLLHKRFGVTKVKPCHCKKFLLNHPCASQVKSKYGTLRFYMTSETEEMSALIQEAEKKSAKTCEICGKKGKYRDDRYWVETLCDKCDKKRNVAKSE